MVLHDAPRGDPEFRYISSHMESVVACRKCRIGSSNFEMTDPCLQELTAWVASLQYSWLHEPGVAKESPKHIV